MTIQFDIFGHARAKQGTKSVYCNEVFVGSRRRERKVVQVFYYDEEYDKISHTRGCCCKSPSYCKSRESAERMVNRFFNEK